MNDIDKYNKMANDFIKKGKNKKGTYKKLQKTKIWANAKKLLLDQASKNNKITCSHCKRPIYLNKQKPSMHHKKYVWTRLFDPKHISFLHFECHQRVHKIKNNYRRRYKKR